MEMLETSRRKGRGNYNGLVNRRLEPGMNPADPSVFTRRASVTDVPARQRCKLFPTDLDVECE